MHAWVLIVPAMLAFAYYSRIVENMADDYAMKNSSNVDTRIFGDLMMDDHGENAFSKLFSTHPDIKGRVEKTRLLPHADLTAY
jgi:Zn-dependent protease with chaperone function